MNLRLLTLVLYLAIPPASLFAQKKGQERIDSLRTELNNTADLVRKVDLYVQMMSTYNGFDREKGIKLLEPALDLAKQSNSDAAIADVHNVAGRIYWRMGRFQEAVAIHEQALEIFTRISDLPKVALTRRYLGQDFADQGNFPDALKYFSESLSDYEALEDIKNQAYLHNLFAWVYSKQGKIVEAVQSEYTSLKLFEQTGDEPAIALAYSNVAEHYIQLGNYDEAINYFAKSAQVYASFGDRISLASNHNLVGHVYRLKRQYPEAIESYEDGRKLATEVNDVITIANAHQGLAEVYLAIRDLPQSLSNYQSANALFKKWNDRINLAHNYCKMGECYRHQLQFSQARAYYDSALTIAKQLENRSLLAEYYQGAASLDSAMGNWRAAYLHQKEYIINRDSTLNQDDIKKMLQLQLGYEFEKKEAAAKASQMEKDERQKRQFISLASIAAIILILSFVFYRGQQKLAAVNLKLQQNSARLEEENRERASIMSIVSHDLKAPFNKIKGLVDLLQRSPQMSPGEVQEYFGHIRNSIEQGSYLINKLLESHTAHQEGINPTFERTDIAKFIHDFEKASHGQLARKSQHLQVEIQVMHQEVLTDRQFLTRILDNLVGNASKFSDSDKSIFLRVWSDENHINFSVRDQGPGISAEDRQKLFLKFQRLTAQPTAGEASTGLGLAITKALVDKLNGVIEVNSQLGEGAQITVRLPILSAV